MIKKNKNKYIENYLKTKQLTGYESRKDLSPEDYEKMGFRCGLEIHQQLNTKKKLFCRCPAGVYQEENDFDAEVVRHMRPTLSELGEYDGTALMEYKTKKNIIYRIKNKNACTYEIDDTPPFLLNKEALDIALEVALLLRLNIVGEFHIARKQYLDGSIPTGFQRTGILGIEGEIPLSHKKVRIIQLSLEEDSCREVTDIGHDRVFRTDRLGMPLIETVTYPDFLNPGEAEEGAHYLRFLARSTGKVRMGIGAARQDVNVSVRGGKRVEIKGVAHIKWIPALTHNEAFRQIALLQIQKHLNALCQEPEKWKLTFQEVLLKDINVTSEILNEVESLGNKMIVINLPHFKGILSFFLSPGRVFADELSDRLKVIACIEKPNLVHSEMLDPVLNSDQWDVVRKKLKASENDAQIILWGPKPDISTAVETVEERCRLAFDGVLNETRKAFKNGTSCFKRVLPGPDRMYPDTDSVPIPIGENAIRDTRNTLPKDITLWMKKLREWKVPLDSYTYLLKKNLCPVIEKIVEDFPQSPCFVATVFSHKLKHIEGQYEKLPEFKYSQIYDLFEFVHKQDLNSDIIKFMLPVIYQHPKMDLLSILNKIKTKKLHIDKIGKKIHSLRTMFKKIKKSKGKAAEIRWLMGQIRDFALGNIKLARIKSTIEEHSDE